jgi:hypothetical protein
MFILLAVHQLLHQQEWEHREESNQEVHLHTQCHAAANLLLFLQMDRRMSSSSLRLLTLQLQLITHQLRLQLSHSNQVVLNPTLGFSPSS